MWSGAGIKRASNCCNRFTKGLENDEAATQDFPLHFSFNLATDTGKSIITFLIEIPF